MRDNKKATSHGTDLTKRLLAGFMAFIMVFLTVPLDTIAASIPTAPTAAKVRNIMEN